MLAIVEALQRLLMAEVRMVRWCLHLNRKSLAGLVVAYSSIYKNAAQRQDASHT